jgi:hypothetical protein
VGHFAGVVSFELIVQILDATNVVVFGIIHTLEDIDVLKTHNWPAKS